MMNWEILWKYRYSYSFNLNGKTGANRAKQKKYSETMKSCRLFSEVRELSRESFQTLVGFSSSVSSSESHIPDGNDTHHLLLNLDIRRDMMTENTVLNHAERSRNEQVRAVVFKSKYCHLLPATGVAVIHLNICFLKLSGICSAC